MFGWRHRLIWFVRCNQHTSEAFQRRLCKQEVGYSSRKLGKGFTLVEILVVVVVISISALIILPMFSSAAIGKVHSAANTIAADLEYAKSCSISSGQIHSVVFDETTESYHIEDESGTTIKHPVKTGFDFIVNFQQDSRLSGVDLLDADFDSMNVVKFDYLGSPYNNSDQPLNSGVVTVQSEGATTTVTVNPVTGFIVVSED